MNSFDFSDGNPSEKRARRALPYRSGIRAVVPITPELIIMWAILKQMRLRLELFYPRDITRWN